MTASSSVQRSSSASVYQAGSSPTFEETFGNPIQAQVIDEEETDLLLELAKKLPDASINPFSYEVPVSRLERWKWMVGVENNFDASVQETYKRFTSYLENHNPTTILQLKNQMVVYWHLNRRIEEYTKFKADSIANAASTQTGKIFFAVIGFLFKCFFKPAITPKVGEDLKTRSQRTYAVIGGFKDGDQEYGVAAFYPINRWLYQQGTVRIGIFNKRVESPSVNLFGIRGPNEGFDVQTGRDRVESRIRRVENGSFGMPPEVLREGDYGHGIDRVSNKGSYLLIHKLLKYRADVEDEHGSDRIIEQKLVQIMVELAMQNKEVFKMKVTSSSDARVLLAGGFTATEGRPTVGGEIMSTLKEFRLQEGNKLFPPSDELQGISTEFKKGDIGKQIVHFPDRSSTTTWVNICSKNRILRAGAAVLPEYWAAAPNLVEG